MTAAGFREEWFGEDSQAVLARLVKIAAAVPGIVLEIGAWEGRSTVAMANAAHPRTIHTCDTWQGSGHEISEQLAGERDVFAQWSANVAEYTQRNVIAHRMGWREWVPTITEPVALAFIDAEHSYLEVYDNIQSLLPLMAPGGIICGDDNHHVPVQDAVTDILGERVFIDATLWVWQMPADEHEADMARLRGAHRDLVVSDQEWRELIEAVEPMWHDYVTTVSKLDHAASPQTLAMLRHIVLTRKPARILDLGSGISTAVLASTASTRQVSSFDTDQAWADKTLNFLSSHGLHNLPICTGQEPFGEFDLIFHDIAGGDERNRWAEIAAQCLAPGGVIVFDDAQNDSHRDAYREVAARHGLELYSLRTRTLDAIERWSMLAVRPATSPALPPTLPPTASNLAVEYERLCNTPSDIYLHLPRFVELVKATNARHVIELGTRTGVSTIAWLHALNITNGCLTSIDIDPRPPIGDHDHWTFIQGNDCDQGVYDRCEPADIVFIDTSHHYRHTLAELRRWVGKVRPGGWIVCHDTELATPEGWPPDDPVYPVKRAIERFTTETGLKWANVPECYGLGLIEVI